MDISSNKFTYIWTTFWILAPLCGSFPIFNKHVIGGNVFYGLVISTRFFPILGILRDLWYPKGVKIVPERIYHLLTPVGSFKAHWIIGDGSSHVRFGTLILCTDNFTVVDVVRLINVLLIKYDIQCTLQYSNNRPRIYIPKKEISKVTKIVKPYITSDKGIS